MSKDNRVSDEKLEEMLSGLEGVTSGPWKNYGGSVGSQEHAERHEVARSDLQWGLNRSGKNADHIARCDPDTIRSILTELQSLRSKPVGVEVKPDFYGVWSGKIHIGTWPDEKTAREVASEYDSPTVVPLYVSPQPKAVTEDMVDRAARALHANSKGKYNHFLPFEDLSAQRILWLREDARAALEAALKEA